jgi:nucleoside-diphosphate-sugar epimerase
MTDTNKIDILITGATGYIGGSVLQRLLVHPDSHKFRFTAVIRAEAKAPKFGALGVNTVIGSHSDSDLMRKLAAKADIVFAIADADDVNAAKGTLAGLKDRYEATGKKPILIHTSGTGTLTDNALGKFTYDTVYDDSDPDQIESLPASQLHRNVDLLIVDADKQGYVDTYIILPSTIYGLAKGPLVDLGIQNPFSVQIPGLIKYNIKRGQSGVVGEGKNTWPHVSNEDIADLYITLYDAIKAGHPSAGHGREGYYFGENGEYQGYEVAKLVAQGLAKHGVGTDEPTPFTEEELKEMGYFGTNARCKATRSRAIGWKPKHTKSDFLASILPEVDAVVAKGV